MNFFEFFKIEENQRKFLNNLKLFLKNKEDDEESWIDAIIDSYNSTVTHYRDYFNQWNGNVNIPNFVEAIYEFGLIPAKILKIFKKQD